MASVLSPVAPVASNLGGKKANADPKKEIWSSLLNSVSSGKRLAEKQLIVLGMFLWTVLYNYVHNLTIL